MGDFYLPSSSSSSSSSVAASSSFSYSSSASFHPGRYSDNVDPAPLEVYGDNDRVSRFVSPLIDTQRIRHPRTGKKMGPARDRPVTFRGRVPPIHPQSIINFTINPMTDQASRCKDKSVPCIAPYEERAEAYMCLEGEIAWIRSTEHSPEALASGIPKTVMAGVHCFTNLAGIRQSEVEFLRPVGMMKNGGAGAGVDQSKDNSAGVVTGSGMMSIVNTGPLPILAGHAVWVSPYPWIIKDAITGQISPGLRAPQTPGKWYGATYTLVDTNVMGLIQNVIVLVNDIIGRGKPFDAKQVNVRSAAEIEGVITERMKDELQLQHTMPMWKFGLLEACSALLDDPDLDPNVVPDSIRQFLINVYNMCMMDENRTLVSYERKLGITTQCQELLKLTDKIKEMQYVELNRFFRRKFTKLQLKYQNKCEDFMKKYVLGFAVSGADRGKVFDIMLGYKC